jgi:Domain of unknown function (DUF1918)
MTARVARRRMWACPGDRLVIRHHHLGDQDRDGEILQALGANGGPPFVVRWTSDGRMSRCYPGSDAFVEHFTPPRARV